MTNSDAQSKIESSRTLPRMPKRCCPSDQSWPLSTILGLAKKIGGQTEGEAHEWAKEIERLVGQLIESYEKQAHRLEEWARGIKGAK